MQLAGCALHGSEPRHVKLGRYEHRKNYAGPLGRHEFITWTPEQGIEVKTRRELRKLTGMHF